MWKSKPVLAGWMDVNRNGVLRNTAKDLPAFLE